MPPDTRAGRRPLVVLNDDQQLRINPALAQEIGFNESVVFLQLEYLISISRHMREDESGTERPWTYQAMDDMKEKYFPWWSVPTISRAIKSLEAAGLIIVGNFNKSTWDRTQWYTLGDKVKELQSVTIFQNEKCIHEQPEEPAQDEKSILQNETSIFQNETSNFQDVTTLPEITTETTPENKMRERGAHPDAPHPETAEEKIVASHPATWCWLDSGFTWPGYDNLSLVIERMGDSPDGKALIKARQFWSLSGYKTNNLIGILDWYEQIKANPDWKPADRFRPNGNGRHPPATKDTGIPDDVATWTN